MADRYYYDELLEWDYDEYFERLHKLVRRMDKLLRDYEQQPQKETAKKIYELTRYISIDMYNELNKALDDSFSEVEDMISKYDRLSE